ncbi:MAG: DUF2079 domain-containing protein [Candidatus Aquicultor sp.]|nr:DUF2079 domain-containing protein [Candidatus Aquicultor sp.]
MSLFRVRDGKFEKMEASGWPEQLKELVIEKLVEGDGLLPERLLVIDGWGAPEGATGLIALDKQGSLVVLLIADTTLSKQAIGTASELAWNLRHTSFVELDAAYAGYLAQKTRLGSELAKSHSEFYAQDSVLDRGLFNQNQRLLVLASEYPEPTLDAMRWRRLELQIDAFSLTFIDIGADTSLARVEPVDLIGGGRIATFFSLILKAPAAIVGRLVPDALDSEEKKDGPDDTGGIETETRSSDRPSRYSKQTYQYAALGAMILLYIATFSFLTVRMHNNFSTYGFDLGIFDQGIWLLSQLKEPFVTVRGLHLFGEHLSFNLVLLAPLYKIWPDVRLLLVLQTVALAIGALPVYLLARDRLKNGVLALALAASYLLYPALQWLNHDQFHPDALVTPALLFAFYFATKRRYVLFAVSALVAVLAKEDVALVMIVMGIYLAVTNNRTVGFATSLASLAWFVVGLKYVLPAFNGTSLFYAQNFSKLGSTIGEVAINTLTKPGLVLPILIQESNLLYITQLLAPVAFSPLASIEVLLISLPALFSNAVSQQGYMHNIEYHYTATIIPFVFAGAILAIEKLALKKREAVVVAALLVAVALASNFFWSPSPISSRHQRAFVVIDETRRTSMERAVALIPDDAVVSASYVFVPHLTHREKIYEFPNPYVAVNWGVNGENPADKDTIDFVIVDFSQLSSDQQKIASKLRNTEFTQVYSRNDILVLRRD